jgi:hypothetical protein
MSRIRDIETPWPFHEERVEVRGAHDLLHFPDLKDELLSIFSCLLDFNDTFTQRAVELNFLDIPVIVTCIACFTHYLVSKPGKVEVCSKLPRRVFSQYSLEFVYASIRLSHLVLHDLQFDTLHVHKISEPTFSAALRRGDAICTELAIEIDSSDLASFASADELRKSILHC